MTRYWKLKEGADDRTVWRTRFGRGYGLVVIQKERKKKKEKRKRERKKKERKKE